MKSLPETASIEFGATSWKPSSRATWPRSVSKFTPASAPAPSGRGPRPPPPRLGDGEARAVAAEHPEVGEQVMTQIDRLGALEVGVSGQLPVDVLLGADQQLPHQRSDRRSRRRGALAGVHGEIRDHLIVA